VDPQSTLLHNLSNVLEAPSLKDVSECTSHDVSRGEAAVERHDAAPTRVNAMAPSWSPIPGKYVADGGVVRDSSFTTTSSSTASSSPSLDEESENHTSPSSQAAASSEPGHVSPPNQPSSFDPPHCIPAGGDNGMADVPLSLPTGRFSCPQCPRKFSGFAKARYGGKVLHIRLTRFNLRH
jgi:hypothetical protein